MSKRTSEMVSIVLVNFRGADDTITCIRSLRKVDWPAEKLEIVCVENGSGDDSAARIAAADPGVTLVKSDDNLGFAGGCNLGVRHARGEYVAFLNNDARPDPGWVRAAVDAFKTSPNVGSVASKVLDWDGQKIDFVEAAITWFGMGYKPFCESPDTGAFDEPRDVLFATGAAMFVRADVFDSVGGFDERYFMFYEDVDLGWRLNLLGWKVRYEPRSLAFHKHHASMNKFGAFRETYLLERNALYTMYKNLDDRSLAQFLPGALLLAVRRAVARGELDSTELDIRRPGDDATPDRPVAKQAMAGIYAIDQLVENITSFTETRQLLQQRRRVGDSELRPLFGKLMEPAYPLPTYLEAHEELVSALGIDAAGRKKRVVIITGEPVSAVMAGPAIRSWNMAQYLSREHEVRLLTFGTAGVRPDKFEVLSVSPRDAHAADVHIDWADVIIFQGHAMAVFPALYETDKVVVVDLYDPMHLEQLEQAKEKGPKAWAFEVNSATEVLNQQLARGDFFLCASERQRHFWLGQLAGEGRLNPLTYAQDNSLGSLLALVPFGLPAAEPVRTAPALRGVVDGIGADDKIVIWGGGIYNWFDPLSLIQAISGLARTHQDIRLFFLGMQHPNPAVPEMQMAVRARQLSEELGLTGRHVFFNEEWVAYNARQNYLLDADVGVSTHFEHIETTFSFRTRILDYLWTRLPIVTTRGDGFGDLVAAEGLGVAVRENDPQALADALEIMLYDDVERGRVIRNLDRVRAEFTWDKTLAPLLEFCRDPHPAADRVLPETMTPVRTAGPTRVLAERVRSDLAIAGRHLRSGGVREMVGAAAGRVKRQLTARKRKAERARAARAQ
ncbi:glycosyltransferase [Nakamurella multipartita]|uniref:Glycosyl transferase family 2 n=1 Tax=Nakamurella multipartita (strain ATCC 700099 / DSM 44233 / CIP 104796 / JCM 9543 / NBRC 105858 / Y-104) TaxID=479431 RepID=C8XIM7_NAKMY|nr:glycosyltransferase [Nakamurella multipartita]ACV80492.1 glycosyl transferase family 2 [Nakamurella multipartita DSM 44233]